MKNQSYPERIRLTQLDGLRGWASLIVLFHHLLTCFLTKVTPILIYTNSLFVTNGHFAVVIFFVLSGLALSINFNLLNTNIFQIFLARYLRLLIPIFATSLAAYFLLKMGLMSTNKIIDADIKFSGWIDHFYRFEASFDGLLKFCFYDIFFSYSQDKTYNPNLWTMSIELVGSYLIYIYLFIFSKLKNNSPKIFFLGTATLFLTLFSQYTLISCFLFGLLLSEIMQKINFNQKNWRAEIFLLAIFILILSINTHSSEKRECIMAGILILTISYSNFLKKIFSNKLSLFLGKISFPLYLVQMLVISTWSTSLFIYLDKLSLNKPFLSTITFISSVVICLLVAYLITPIEKFSIKFSKVMTKKIIGN